MTKHFLDRVLREVESEYPTYEEMLHDAWDHALMEDEIGREEGCEVDDSCHARSKWKMPL